MPELPRQSNAEQQMAIIRNPHFGVGDRGTVALWFETYITPSSCALQVFGVDQAVEIIAAYGVDDVPKLEGKPCWVRVSSSLIEWAGAWTR